MGVSVPLSGRSPRSGFGHRIAADRAWRANGHHHHSRLGAGRGFDGTVKVRNGCGRSALGQRPDRSEHHRGRLAKPSGGNSRRTVPVVSGTERGFHADEDQRGTFQASEGRLGIPSQPAQPRTHRRKLLGAAPPLCHASGLERENAQFQGLD